ncbi:MAG: hypothetical protein A2Y40_03310 [Candidatus Margulisbacteria bacterium GWF2_35_9]|nr:MAG: hypothetical protein A2Y40_03310 [Candidatus Margulisbacteria bacterium GWF2_35_9]
MFKKLLFCLIIIFIIPLCFAGDNITLFNAIERNDLATLINELDKDKSAINGYLSGTSGKETPLMIAIKEGKNDIVKELINRGADLNIKDLIHWSPIHYSAVYGNEEAAKMLINAGVKIPTDNAQKDRFIFTAAQGGNAWLVQKMLDRGDPAEVNYIGSFDNGKTPLMFAAKRGHDDIAKMLIDHGASTKSKNKDGFTVLMAACGDSDFSANSGSLWLLKKCIDDGANINESTQHGYTAIYYAAFNGNQDIIDILLEKGVNTKITMKENSLLHAAARGGSVSLIKQLVNDGYDANMFDYLGMTPLMYAAEKVNLQSALALLEAGADPNILDSQKQNALFYLAENASELNDDKANLVAKALIDHKVDVMQFNTGHAGAMAKAAYGGARKTVSTIGSAGAMKDDDMYYNAWEISCKKGHETLFQYLSFFGGDPTVYWGSYDLMMSSAKGGNAWINSYLIEQGVTVNRKNEKDYNMTAIHYAAEYGHAKIIDQLCKAGADVNAKNDDYWTPLRMAVNKGYYEASKTLLENNADVNISDGSGTVPLHRAVDMNRLDLVKLLLDHKARVLQKDKYKNTPLDYAKKKGYLEMIALIEPLEKEELGKQAEANKLREERQEAYKKTDEYKERQKKLNEMRERRRNR